MLDATGGVQSLPEKDFDDLILLAGLPRPTRQRAVRGKDGRYYLDVEWEAYGVAAEVHGLPHHGIVQWSADLVRANEIIIDGPRLLIFTSYVIRHEAELVLDQIVRALRAGGWMGHGARGFVAAREATVPRARSSGQAGPGMAVT
ncbi:MAG: hypothetical protein EON52_28420 [Actinomycetales bacterium]|nr:MAG: hypothetical protein EON52_28420 [Actinomycetales bacterium]